VIQAPRGSAYLFEFVPPVGKGKDRVSVRLARFETEQQAYQHGDGLLEKYPAQTIKIFRVGPNGESIPIGSIPNVNATSTPASDN
jgi:hypothetical protein